MTPSAGNSSSQWGYLMCYWWVVNQDNLWKSTRHRPAKLREHLPLSAIRLRCKHWVPCHRNVYGSGAHPGQRETWKWVLFEGQREKNGHLCGHTAKSVYSQRATEAHRTRAKLNEMLYRVLLLQSSQTSVGITGTSTDRVKLCWRSPLLALPTQTNRHGAAASRRKQSALQGCYGMMKTLPCLNVVCQTTDSQQFLLVSHVIAI